MADSWQRFQPLFLKFHGNTVWEFHHLVGCLSGEGCRLPGQMSIASARTARSQCSPLDRAFNVSHKRLCFRKNNAVSLANETCSWGLVLEHGTSPLDSSRPFLVHFPNWRECQRECQTEWQNRCQIECQKRCQIECQKEWKIDCQTRCRIEC